MAQQRLSKLQKWILMEWDNDKLHKQEQIQPSKKSCDYFHSEYKDWRNSLWVYYNFFGVKDGKETFKDLEYDESTKSWVTKARGFKAQNKYVVATYRSLISMDKKGLIEIFGRCLRGRGPTLFSLTDKGKALSLLLITRQKSGE